MVRDEWRGTNLRLGESKTAMCVPGLTVEDGSFSAVLVHSALA